MGILSYNLKKLIGQIKIGHFSKHSSIVKETVIEIHIPITINLQLHLDIVHLVSTELYNKLELIYLDNM
jgi:hypothetical protein